MLVKSKKQKQAKILRIARKIHRYTGVFLFVFFFILSVTGLLLGWKKNSNGYLLSKSYQGSSTELSNWLPLDSLHKNACKFLKDSVSSNLTTELARIDVRKDKGMVKFVFKDHFWGIQLDGSTGKLLHIEKRRADFIEALHDGSLVDFYLKNSNGVFKLIYTSILGIALLIFTFTGFWLWYGPKHIRRTTYTP